VVFLKDFEKGTLPITGVSLLSYIYKAIEVWQFNRTTKASISFTTRAKKLNTLCENVSRLRRALFCSL
jgi:hypothetical protein